MEKVFAFDVVFNLIKCDEGGFEGFGRSLRAESSTEISKRRLPAHSREEHARHNDLQKLVFHKKKDRNRAELSSSIKVNVQ